MSSPSSEVILLLQRKQLSYQFQREDNLVHSLGGMILYSLFETLMFFQTHPWSGLCKFSGPYHHT